MPSLTKTKATSSTREKSSTSMPNMTKPNTANPEEYLPNCTAEEY